MATIELWKTGHRDRPTGQWKAWLSFALGIGLSLCANIASAPELNTFSIAVAACPPLALLLSVELLNQALKRRRTETTNRAIHQSEEAQPTSPISTISDLATPSPEESDKAEEAAALRTVMNNEPGHNVNNDQAGSEPPRCEFDDQLREEAYRLDTEHWHWHHRPISADTLRRNLHIGSKRARTLTRHIRQHHQPRQTTAAG